MKVSSPDSSSTSSSSACSPSTSSTSSSSYTLSIGAIFQNTRISNISKQFELDYSLVYVLTFIPVVMLLASKSPKLTKKTLMTLIWGKHNVMRWTTQLAKIVMIKSALMRCSVIG